MKKILITGAGPTGTAVITQRIMKLMEEHPGEFEIVDSTEDADIVIDEDDVNAFNRRNIIGERLVEATKTYEITPRPPIPKLYLGQPNYIDGSKKLPRKRKK